MYFILCSYIHVFVNLLDKFHFCIIIWNKIINKNIRQTYELKKVNHISHDEGDIEV
jgi:hypothetical protein